MSNDANALKRKEQIKKILVYGGMVMLCLVSFYFIFKQIGRATCRERVSQNV